MRILLVHNFYQQFGGTDAVVANEAALLEQHGDDVRLFLALERRLVAHEAAPGGRRDGLLQLLLRRRRRLSRTGSML